MAKRCLIVSYYFPPTGGGGVQRISKLIKYLSKDNWEFSVLTAENEPAALPDDDSLLKEIPAQTKIYRVKIPGSHHTKGSLKGKIKSGFLVRWISSFIFIPDARKNWLEPAREKIFEILKDNKIDIIIITAPPYSLELLAAELTKKLSIPVVVDLRDPWTTNPYKIHPSKWHFYKDRKLEIKAVSDIKYGVAAYRSQIDFYKTQISGFRSNNWEYIPNGYDSQDFENLKVEQLDPQKLHLAFSGTFYSHINRPQFLFKAIASLPADLKEKICFHHIGDAVVDLEKIAKDLDIQENIRTWGYQNHKRCLEILAGMDAYCFILDSKNNNSGNTIGGKVYEYIKLRKPILALVPEQGEASDLISLTKSGKVIDPYKTNEIKELLTLWIKQKPILKNTTDFPEFERFELARKYAKFMNDVISDNQKSKD
ncbi:MAG: glycosyltransferase [Calditrichae bacterium]|nr:glycosyltransferase [Calditrichia bacterium]